MDRVKRLLPVMQETMVDVSYSVSYGASVFRAHDSDTSANIDKIIRGMKEALDLIDDARRKIR